MFQMLLNSITCRPNLAFDRLFHQVIVWLINIHDSSLGFREHIPPKVKSLRGRECLGDCLRELGGWWTARPVQWTAGL
jgi:hypothetical protein